MELPSGTVTFLFTDIEGSTALLKQLGAGYEQVLTDHQRLLEEAFQGANGRIVDTQGDAFFVAFSSAQDAVGAAADAQRNLAAHTWPVGAEPRVRMGIHTGEPALVEAHLIGLSVHRAARICAAAHGGQVLLSSTTRDLVEERLPPGIRLIDLGNHRLKDIDKPERIAQLVIAGLPPDFTPPKRVDAQPVKATPFAGEERRLGAAAKAAVVPSRQMLIPWTQLMLARLRDVLPRRGLSHRHRGHSGAIEAIGLRIHASSRIAPSELRSEVAHLGGAVAVAARVAADADRLITETDAKVLARRLREYRESAPLSERTVEAAEGVARQLAAVELLQERRRQFDDEVTRLAPRLKVVEQKIFQSRLDHDVPAELAAEVSGLREEVNGLASSMQQACDGLRREQQPRFVGSRGT